MTAVRVRARALDEADRPELDVALAADPIGQCVVAARLAATTGPANQAAHLGGRLWGLGPAGALRAVILAGGNLVPVLGEPADLRALAAELAQRPRPCSSVVGHRDAVLAVWEELRRPWGPARDVRTAQPLLATSRPADVHPDPLVRRVVPAEITRYLPAAQAMFGEELGFRPAIDDPSSPYRRRVADLVAGGLAFARFDDDGRVLFKAEIAAVSDRCCQVQGVWVDPGRRGRGVGTAGMAAVIRAGLALAPTVSLYVNDYNRAARRVYDRLGMQRVGTFATVLY